MRIQSSHSETRFLVDMARSVRLGIVVLAALTLAQYAAGLSIPWLSGQLTGALIASEGTGSHILNALFLGLAAALVIQGVLAIVHIRHSARLQMNLSATTQARLYAHLQELPLGFFHQRRTGSLLSLIAHDVSEITGFVATGIAPALPHVITFLAALGLMMNIDWKLGASVGLAVPLFFLVFKLFMRRIRPLSLTYSQAIGDASAHAESHLSAMLLMKAFNRGESSSNEYARQVNRIAELGEQIAVALGRIQPGLNLLAGLTAVGIVWLFSGMISRGALSPGELVSFLMYGYFLARPMSQMASLYGELQHAQASAGKILEVLDSPPEQSEPGAKPVSKLRGEVEFRHVHFAYPNRPPVLMGVNLHLRPGETVVLVGENGCGKSTLAHLLLRLAEPDQGEVLLDGMKAKDLQLESLRAQIGFVPQTVLLIEGSIAENILFGRENVSRNRIEAAARLAQAAGFIEALPEGYDTLVGERGVKLSGGQQQRIALARALLDDPPILVLDEATSHFDLEGEKQFLESLSEAFKDRTVLLITHRPAALAAADYIVQMKNGRIVHDDPRNRRLHLA